MAYSILGTPKPQFFDNSGDLLASGTIETRNPDTDALIDNYPTADDADAGTNANDNPQTLNSRGEPANGLFGVSGTPYKLILKTSGGTTIWTVTDVGQTANKMVHSNGTVVATAAAEGVDITGTAGGSTVLDVVATSTNNPVVGVRGAANGGMRFYWDESASTGYIVQTDANGTVEDIWLSFGKNGAVTMYYNNTAHFRTLSTEGQVEVVNNSGGTAVIQISSNGNGTARMYTGSGGTHIQDVQGSSANLYIDAYDGSAFYNGMRIAAVSGAPRIGFYNATPAVKPTVTGSRGGNAALASLLTNLATLGLITDSSS